MFSDNLMAKSLSVGASYVTDMNAPTELTKADNGYLYADGSGNLLYNPGYAASGFGVDAEVKVLKTKNTDIKIYGDYSQLVLPSADGASTFGDGGAPGALFQTWLQAGAPLDEETDDVRMGKRPARNCTPCA